MDITPSIIQKKVEHYITRIFIKYTVNLEYYDKKTASFIDLVVKRDPNHPEYDVCIQVDGPTHYYTNHQPIHDVTIVNGATEFRNKLHTLNSFKPYVISYVDIDNYNYYANLMEVLHTFPAGYQAIQSGEDNISTEIDSAQSIVTSVIDYAKEVKISKKIKKSSKAEKDDYELILAQARADNAKILSPEEKLKDLKDKYHIAHKTTSLTSLLAKVVEAKNLDEFEFILQYENPVRSTSSSSQEKPSFNESYLKILIEAFKLGYTQVFQYVLSLIPDSDNKVQLMEYFLINCGKFNHIEIADFLLNNNIDINSCYSRESVEILYALATGTKHNGKVIKDASKVIKSLYNNLVTPKKTVEDLLQEAAKGSLDKGEGISEGRGITALHLSSYAGEKSNDIRLFLLKNNANPNTMTIAEVTPLMTALLSQDEAIALQILDFSPNINLKTKNGVTAATLAAKAGYSEVMKKIISLNGDLVTKISKDHQILNSKLKEISFCTEDTPLSIALKLGHIEIAEALIDAKVNLNYQIYDTNVAGEFPTSIPKFIGSILIYCIIKYPHLVKKLLDNGENVDTKFGPVTPLMLAAQFSNVDTRLENEGEEGSRKATQFSKYNIFENLLSHGADIRIQDQSGDTVEVYTTSSARLTVHQTIIKKITKAEITGINIEARSLMIANVQEAMNNPFFEIKCGKFHFILPIPDVLKYNYMLTNGAKESSAKYELKDIVKNLNIGTQLGQLTLDVAKIYSEPTNDNFKKFVIDLNYLAGSYYGTNSYSIVVTASKMIEDLYQGNYYQTLKQGVTSYLFMQSYYILSNSNLPFATTAFTTGLVI